MSELPFTIILELTLLTVFLTFITGLKYVIPDNFMRTRVIMTSFFLFIVSTLTISFWQFTWATLPFTVPAALVGMIVGYFVGVRTERKKLETHGIEHYMEHFAHIHLHDVVSLNWWSLINFYSVIGGLLLINLVGLSTVIFGGEIWAIVTSTIGAFLLGSILPYLYHLWSIHGEDAETV